MKKATVWLLLLVLLLTGCAPVTDHGEPQYTFYDGAGRAVCLPGRPQKVAVLFSSFAQIWGLAGGQVSFSVGESVERGFCPAETPLVDGGAGKQIDLERLVSYQPDFVIGSADLAAHTEAAAFLEQAGIPCGLFRVDTFDDYLKMLQVCTQLTGNEEAYQTYGIRVQQQMQDLMQRIDGQKAPKVLFVRAGSGMAKAKNAAQHFAAAMLGDLGAENIADAAPILLDGLSAEEILARDPDYIFVSTMGEEQAVKAYIDSLLQQPPFRRLSAVRNQRVIILPKELFQYKPNHRWAEAYRQLAMILYPEIVLDE